MVFRDSPRHLENTFWVAYFLYYIYTFLCFFSGTYLGMCTARKSYFRIDLRGKWRKNRKKHRVSPGNIRRKSYA